MRRNEGRVRKKEASKRKKESSEKRDTEAVALACKTKCQNGGLLFATLSSKNVYQTQTNTLTCFGTPD